MNWKMHSGQPFHTFLLKAIIWREEYEHIPSVLARIPVDDKCIRDTLKYSVSLDMLRERQEYIHGKVPEPAQFQDSTEYFIQSCLDYRALVQQMNGPELYILQTFKDFVTLKDIRGIQVCLRAVVSLKRDDIICCLKETVGSAEGLTVVKAITDIIVLSSKEIDTIIDAKDAISTDCNVETKNETSELHPDIKLLLRLKQKSLVLEGFIKENQENLMDAYFGFRTRDGEVIPTIVAIFKIPPFKELGPYKGYNLEYRHAFSAYSESIEAEYGSKHGDPGGLIKCQPVISKHLDYLMKNHRNLNIIRGSTVRSRQTSGSVERQNCILCSCYVKGVIPDGDLEFPGTLAGIPVDVREGVFYLYAGKGNTENSTSTLKMGSRICKTDDKFGSLGGFVKDASGENMCFITCAHILNDVSGCSPGSVTDITDDFPVSQMDHKYQSNECGEHVRSVVDRQSALTVDASLIKISEENIPLGGYFVTQPIQYLNNAGFEELPTFNDGKWKSVDSNDIHKNFIKIGAATGITRGCLRLSGAAARIQDYAFPDGPRCRLIFKGQHEYLSVGGQPFATFGDSGSFVFMVEPTGDKKKPKLTCVGMVCGGTSDFIVFVTPIKEVLNALGLHALNVFRVETNMDLD